MFSSDYPHAECRFPGSVDLMPGWDGIESDLTPKLLWDNAAGCFGLGDKGFA